MGDHSLVGPVLGDRVVVVTGAGRGLGRAYALDLAARGAGVVVNTRPRPADQPGSAEAVVAEIEAVGGRAVACALAVEDDDAGDRLLACALQTFGRLDGLINNAGTPEGKTLHKQSLAEIREGFEVNFFGGVAVTLPIYRHMREHGAGRIVLTTSSAGLHGVHGMAAYSASKAAAIGLMRVIAIEGATHGVHANAVAPYALTAMTSGHVPPDLGRQMPAEAVAPVVSWLMTEACPLNGETLVVGAGRVRRAARIEGPGIRFDPADACTPAALQAAAADILSLDGATAFDHGLSAFDDFLSATSATLITPS